MNSREIAALMANMIYWFHGIPTAWAGGCDEYNCNGCAATFYMRGI